MKYDGDADKLYDKLVQEGFLPGVRFEDGFIFAVTEKRSKEEIDKMVKIINEFK